MYSSWFIVQFDTPYDQKEKHESIKQVFCFLNWKKHNATLRTEKENVWIHRSLTFCGFLSLLGEKVFLLASTILLTKNSLVFLDFFSLCTHLLHV